MPASATPWIVAGLLCVITIAAVVYAANKRSAPASPSMANAGNAVTGIADDPSTPGLPAGAAPDISHLTPKQQFTKLDARIDQMLQRGDTANVAFFIQMALQAYANLPPTDRDIDTRYHAAMRQAQLGGLDTARALADTILRQSPDNLLGYYVRAMAFEFAGDSAGARTARAAFRAHYVAEIKKDRPEYAEHRAFLEQYRNGDGAK